MLREALIIKFADRYEVVGINYGVGENNFYKQNINSVFFCVGSLGHHTGDGTGQTGQVSVKNEVWRTVNTYSRGLDAAYRMQVQNC